MGAVMESWDLVSRLVSRPIFASLGLVGFRSLSVSKATGLETLNITKKWFSKFLIFQRFLFVVFAGKNHRKQVGKLQKFGQTHKLWSLESRNFLWSLGLGIVSKF